MVSAIFVTFRDSNSCRLLPGSSYSHCICNLHAIMHEQCHPVNTPTAHEILQQREWQLCKKTRPPDHTGSWPGQELGLRCWPMPILPEMARLFNPALRRPTAVSWWWTRPASPSFCGVCAAQALPWAWLRRSPCGCTMCVMRSMVAGLLHQPGIASTACL
jgi:hypothetical protein